MIKLISKKYYNRLVEENKILKDNIEMMSSDIDFAKKIAKTATLNCTCHHCGDLLTSEYYKNEGYCEDCL